ncbi:MAG TPA: CpsB/CapC family capsule biosynthesis tyrosine phosphatase [Thermoleophilaceae bacterium]|jgi:protein-tyrosine phosphatase
MDEPHGGSASTRPWGRRETPATARRPPTSGTVVEPLPGRAEIHFHLLPGVDDGPATVDESVDLARAALADGTTTIVATPHVGDVRVAEVPARLQALRAELARAELPLRVIAGGELAPWDVPALGRDELASIAVGPAGRRWALLEAPTYAATIDEIQAAAGALRAEGLAVVLAHPERSPALLGAGGWDALAREVERGSILQVSAPSLLGVYGRAVRAAAERIVVALHEVCAIASDAHSPARPPMLADALSAVARLAGDRRARALVEEGPSRLIELGSAAFSRVPDLVSDPVTR